MRASNMRQQRVVPTRGRAIWVSVVLAENGNVHYLKGLINYLLKVDC